MRAPSKTRRVKKYMILFSVLLFIVVLSIVLAFYVGTKKFVDDIPNKVGEQFQELPESKKMALTLESMKLSLDNITEGQEVIDKGNAFYRKMTGASAINRKHNLSFRHYYLCLIHNILISQKIMIKKMKCISE